MLPIDATRLNRDVGDETAASLEMAHEAVTNRVRWLFSDAGFSISTEFSCPPPHSVCIDADRDSYAGFDARNPTVTDRTLEDNSYELVGTVFEGR